MSDLSMVNKAIGHLQERKLDFMRNLAAGRYTTRLMREKVRNEIAITQTAVNALIEKRDREYTPIDVYMNARGNWVITCPTCESSIEGTRRQPNYCGNCGRSLKEAQE